MKFNKSSFLHSIVNLSHVTSQELTKQGYMKNLFYVFLTNAYTKYASVTIKLRRANSLLVGVGLISEKIKISADMEEIWSGRERSTWSKSS